MKIFDNFEDISAKIGRERLIGMIQGYELTKNYFAKMDKEEVVEKYQSKKIMRSLALVEKRLDELESLRENFSKGSGI